MAYTYDQFVTAATGAGLLDKFDDDELRIVRSNPEYGMSALKLRQDLQGAKTTEQKMLAQESLNQLRKSYGGTVASSTPPASGTGGTAGSFQYGGENAYQKLLGEVTNPAPFEYDHSKDPSFQAMKKTHLREAERATEDTMGSFAAMTGGVPSSAAITAASQAGDYYRSQLTDAIPQLQQNAYQRDLAEIDAKNAALNAMTADRNFDWQKYLAEYDQQFNREQFDWQKYLAEYDQQQSQIQQDAAAKQQEWANAFALYQQLGYATPEIAAILGIPVSNNQGTAGSGNGSGGSGGSGGRDSNTGLTEQQEDAVINYVQSMLDNASGSRFDPYRVINGNSSLSPAERAYALAVLQEFLNQGYMKTPS